MAGGRREPGLGRAIAGSSRGLASRLAEAQLNLSWQRVPSWCCQYPGWARRGRGSPEPPRLPHQVGKRQPGMSQWDLVRASAAQTGSFFQWCSQEGNAVTAWKMSVKDKGSEGEVRFRLTSASLPSVGACPCPLFSCLHFFPCPSLAAPSAASPGCDARTLRSLAACLTSHSPLLCCFLSPPLPAHLAGGFAGVNWICLPLPSSLFVLQKDL